MIQNLPPFFDMVYVQDDNKLSRDGYLYNDQTFQVLNIVVSLLNTLLTTSITTTNISIDGLKAPQKTTAEITALEPNADNGTLWFNTTLAKLQVKTAPGTIETITST